MGLKPCRAACPRGPVVASPLPRSRPPSRRPAVWARRTARAITSSLSLSAPPCGCWRMVAPRSPPWFDDRISLPRVCQCRRLRRCAPPKPLMHSRPQSSIPSAEADVDDDRRGRQVTQPCREGDWSSGPAALLERRAPQGAGSPGRRAPRGGPEVLHVVRHGLMRALRFGARDRSSVVVSLAGPSAASGGRLGEPGRPSRRHPRPRPARRSRRWGEGQVGSSRVPLQPPRAPGVPDARSPPAADGPVPRPVPRRARSCRPAPAALRRSMSA